MRGWDIAPPPHVYSDPLPFQLFGQLVGLFLFFDFDDFTAFVVTAVRADSVGQAHLAAVAALHQVCRFQGVVRPAAIPASFGQFALWMWGHGLTPFSFDNQAKACPLGRRTNYIGK